MFPQNKFRPQFLNLSFVTQIDSISVKTCGPPRIDDAVMSNMTVKPGQKVVFNCKVTFKGGNLINWDWKNVDTKKSFLGWSLVYGLYHQMVPRDDQWDRGEMNILILNLLWRCFHNLSGDWKTYLRPKFGLSGDDSVTFGSWDPLCPWDPVCFTFWHWDVHLRCQECCWQVIKTDNRKWK